MKEVSFAFSTSCPPGVCFFEALQSAAYKFYFFFFKGGFS